MAKQKIFIGVAWPYVNGNIHLGHLAGYLLPADIFARFNRFIGNDVLMVSGSDCFGTPITLEADKRNLSAAEVVEEHHAKNLELFKFLNLSFDIYTKTDNPIHIETVQNIFVELINKGFIYRDSSEQYYSETENRFLPDRYVEGTCPHCDFSEARSDQCDNCGKLLASGELKNPISKLTKTPVVMKATEHYFFDWPKLEPFLKTYLKNHGPHWRNWIYREAEGWLSGGLKGRAITRDLDWGVEIPVERLKADQIIEGHEHKRIYVWFEAVIGYLSASIKYSRDKGDESWKDYWYNDKAGHYYFMGKDNLVFHTIFWPGQLHAYDEKLHLPDILPINQFLTFNNEGLSKSRGHSLDPEKIASNFGLDVLRFYICLIMPENHDSDFSWSDFIVKVNNLLIANLGNFINRTLKLAEGIDFSKTKLSPLFENKLIETYLTQGKDLLEKCEFKNYAEHILAFSSGLNLYLSNTTPWKIKEEDPESYASILFGAMAAIVALSAMICPIMPETSEKLEKMLGIKIDTWPDEETVFDVARKINITNPEPLFKKIEVDPEKENFNEKYK